MQNNDHYNYFSPSERSVAREDFRRVFHLPLGDYIDTLLSFLSGRCTLDIFAFDAKMHERFGDYEDEGLSLEELVEREYGPEGRELLLKLIG